MKLWLLQRIDTATYDQAVGFVVRARSEEQARQAAGQMAGDELAGTWADPARSTCVPLLTQGPAGVVLRDFHAG